MTNTKTNINKEFIDYAIKEMTAELIRFSNGTLDTVKSTELAKVAVSEIDWSNSALMHKGISWIAKNYLEKLNRISAKAPVLKTINGMIKLDPNNPQHREWFEEDNRKGK